MGRIGVYHKDTDSLSADFSETTASPAEFGLLSRQFCLVEPFEKRSLPLVPFAHFLQTGEEDGFVVLLQAHFVKVYQDLNRNAVRDQGGEDNRDGCEPLVLRDQRLSLHRIRALFASSDMEM